MLDRSQLASRLTLNCTDSYIEPQKLKDVYVTIMDVSIMLGVKCLHTTLVFLRFLMNRQYHNAVRKKCTSVILTPKEHI